MATFKLSNAGGIIPEGKTTFKITEVDDSKYEDFGTVTIRMATEGGQTHFETFRFIRNDGTSNTGAVNAFSYFAKTALQNYDVDEIDFADLTGRFIGAEVTHRAYTNRDGEERTAVNLGRYYKANGFDGDGADDGLDDLL